MDLLDFFMLSEADDEFDTDFENMDATTDEEDTDEAQNNEEDNTGENEDEVNNTEEEEEPGESEPTEDDNQDDENTDDYDDTTDDNTSDEDSMNNGSEEDIEKFKQKKLLNDYIKFYNDTIIIIEKINNNKKNADYLQNKSLDSCLDNLERIKDDVYQYLTELYNTKTYSENLYNYYVFLKSVKITNKIVEKIVEIQDKQ